MTGFIFQSRLSLLAVCSVALTSIYSAAAAPTATHAPATYTYTLINNGVGCPSLLPTASAQVIDAVSEVYYDQGVEFAGWASKDGTVLPQVAVFYVDPYNDRNLDEIDFRTDNISRIQLFTYLDITMVIDLTGIRIWNAGAKKQLHLPIPNLIKAIKANDTATPSSTTTTAQVAALALETANPSSSSVSTLKITVDFIDQCGNPIIGHSANATCFGYNSTQYLGDPAYGTLIMTDSVPLTGDKFGVYKGSCSIPPSVTEFASTKNCYATVRQAILNYPSQGIVAKLRDLTPDLVALGNIITSGVIPSSIPSAVVESFNISTLPLAIEALAFYVKTVEFQSLHDTERMLCAEVGFHDEAVEVYAQLDVQKKSVLVADLESYVGIKFPKAVNATVTQHIRSVTCSGGGTTSTN